MREFFRAGRIVILTLVFTAITSSLWAQVIVFDSSAVSRSQAEQEIGRLKSALRRQPNSVQEADTLLNRARKLGYIPGQVIALCHLVGIYLQEQQTQQADALIEEASQLSKQIHDTREAGWAMAMVGRMQGSNARKNPTFTNALMPVLESLNVTMTSNVLAKRKEPNSLPVEVIIPKERRVTDRRSFPANPSEYINNIPIPNYDPAIHTRFRIKPDFVDRWLDTLIRSGTKNTKVVRQLTERKKLRDSTQVLSKAFAKAGNYAEAYKYYLQYTAYKDSLTAEATSRRLASLSYKQNLLRKEAQIQLLTKDRQLRDQEAHKQRQYVFLMIGCIVLLTGFAIVLSRNNRAKQLANKQLNDQKEALQATLAQLKTTQNQLIHAEKMASLGELTAGIAHEIQNPLNFVNNFSEVSTELVAELIETRQLTERDEELENELLDDVQLNLQKIKQHGHRAASIVKGMLEHARPSSGQKEKADLNALIDEYFKLAYHGIRAKDKTFEARMITELDPTLAQITIVPQEIGQVLLNVFNNAFYAVQKRQQSSPDNFQPEVTVKTKKGANRIKIIIRDNGIGVPDSIKLKIFQPFFTTKPTGQGTGLGLSLSYDIITKGHNGTFTLVSKENEYTEAVITLPIGA
ncbi:sensor histidine kinase [Spirosoma harenae]